MDPPGHRFTEGVAHDVLASCTSRHGDHDGYWVWGFLVDWAGERVVDFTREPEGSSPEASLARHARATVARALVGRPFGVDDLAVARVVLRRAAGFVRRPVRSHEADAYDVRVRIDLAWKGWADDHVAERAKTIVVAAHDPKAEWRSPRDRPLTASSP